VVAGIVLPGAVVVGPSAGAVVAGVAASHGMLDRTGRKVSAAATICDGVGWVVPVVGGAVVVVVGREVDVVGEGSDPELHPASTSTVATRRAGAEARGAGERRIAPR
jgi:hypothetical protein